MSDSAIESTVRLLRELGCRDSSGFTENTDLLRYLASRSEDDAIASRAAVLHESGSSLRIPTSVESDWVGERLIWTSVRTRFTRAVAIISSRLDRKLDCNDIWFHVLRTIVLRAKPRQDQFLVAKGTTAERFVRRATELFGRSTVELVAPVEQHTTVQWVRNQLFSGALPTDQVALSPPIRATVHPALQDVPLRDRALMAFADHVIALQVRSQGNTYKILSQAAADKVLDPGSILVCTDLCDGPSMDLLDCGITGLHLIGNEDSLTVDPLEVNATPNIIDVDTIEPGKYLTHWTRRPRGPWPDQRDTDFWDELILNLSTRNRSALAALARIVAQRKLWASVKSNRSGNPIVSFSAVPLRDWLSLRKFRPHRSRWDFEPYGICVSRKWFIDQGGRAVIYGDDDDWSQLPSEQRHLFQPRTSTTRGGNEIDWTCEKEFRRIGDLDLSQLASEQAALFVPSMKEAQHLSAISPWPIAILTDGTALSH